MTQLANADQIFSILCRQGFALNFVFINFKILLDTFSFKLVLQNNFSHEKYFQGVLILASVLFVLYREALVVERLRRLPRMQEGVWVSTGSNITRTANPISNKIIRPTN